LLALALLLAAVGQASIFAMSFDCFDFYQFWVVGQAAPEEGTGNVWSGEERRRLAVEWQQRAAREQEAANPSPRRALAAESRAELETYSTPWLYTLFGWTATGDYDRDLGWFQQVSLVAFVLAVLGLARLVGLAWSLAALLAAFLLAFFAPLLSDVSVGNVNRLQFAALALSLVLGARAWRGADLAAGGVLGLAVLFKPNLAYCALALGLGWVLLGRSGKLVRQAGGAALGALAAFAASSAWFGGARAWVDWGAVLGELLGEYDHSRAKGNFALARLLGDLGLPLAGPVLSVLLGGALLAALVLRRRAGVQPTGLEDLALAGLGGAISLLSARLAWMHYYLLALPLGIFLLRPGARPWLRRTGAAGLVLVAHKPTADLLRYDDAGAFAAALVSAGVLLLSAMTLLELARPWPPGAPLPPAAERGTRPGSPAARSARSRPLRPRVPART
jgi:4-amino-4-deoxy-L-arabinose transferase-like glycosyltransferase